MCWGFLLQELLQKTSVAARYAFRFNQLVNNGLTLNEVLKKKNKTILQPTEIFSRMHNLANSQSN